jgi:hypothetical protein
VNPRIPLLLIAALVVAWLTSGCNRCNSDGDCGLSGYCTALGSCETQCFTNDDCLRPPECAGQPNCAPKGRYCTATGQCVGIADITPPKKDPPPPLPQKPVLGWDTPAPGYGLPFIVNALSIASPTQGCASAGCQTNALAQLATLLNPTISDGLIAGETLILIELAGLAMPFNGTQEDAFTIKLYGATDTNDTPGDNFDPQPGSDVCCTFNITPESLKDGQPTARSAARAELGLMRSVAPMTLDLSLRIGSPPYRPIRLEQAMIQANLGSSASHLKNGQISAALPISTLANTPNPYCKIVDSGLCGSLNADSNVFELLYTLEKPDVDLNGDGLYDHFDIDPQTGRVAKCWTGSTEIPPLVPGKGNEWTCAQAAHDGYSVTLEFSARPAKVIGLAP